MRAANLVKQLRRWPFTVIGVLTLAIAVVAEMGIVQSESFLRFLRVLIIPVYVARLLVVAVEVLIWGAGPTGPPRFIDVLTLPLLLVPYLFVDLLVRMMARKAEV